MDHTGAAKALTRAVTWLGMQAGPTQLRRYYYDGKHRTQLHSPDFVNPHRLTIEGIRDNRCRPVVNTTVDALTVQTFRPADDASEIQAVYAEKANQIWARSHMDLRADQWLRGSEITGQPTAIIVEADDDEGLQAELWPQQPEQVYVYSAPSDPCRALWAVKLWKGDDDRRRATVYTDGPEHFVYAERHPQDDTYGPGTVSPDQAYAWQQQVVNTGAQSWDLETVVPNNLPGVCPVSVAAIGYSDLDDAIPLQDMLNAELQREAVSGEYYAFITRFFLGMEGKLVDGKIVPPFDVSANRQYFLPRDETGQAPSVMDLPGQDPAPFLAAADSHREAIARITSTPAYMLQQGEPPSGVALITATKPFTTKIHNRQAIYGAALADALEYAVTLEYALAGVELTEEPDLVCVWAEDDLSAEADRVKTVATLSALGVPLSTLLTRYMGWSREDADAAQTAIDVAGLQRAADAAAFGMPPVA